MADFTVSGGPWLPGTLIATYAGEGWQVGFAPHGPVVDSATVQTDGSVTFVGLEEERGYVAWAQSRGVRFYVSASNSLREALPDRERIRELELTGGGGGGGPVDTGTLMGFCMWDEFNEVWTFDGAGPVTARPDFDGKLIWLGGGGDADPTPSGLELAGEGDVWIPSEVVA